MAKNPTSNYTNGRTFTCSVPATVYPRDDYEYAVSVFGTMENDYPDYSSGYRRHSKLNYNMLIESSFPIYFETVTGSSSYIGEVKGLCLYTLRNPWTVGGLRVTVPARAKAILSASAYEYNEQTGTVRSRASGGSFVDIIGKETQYDSAYKRNDSNFGFLVDYPFDDKTDTNCDSIVVPTNNEIVSAFRFNYHSGNGFTKGNNSVFCNVVIHNLKTQSGSSTDLMAGGYIFLKNGTGGIKETDKYTFSIGNLNNPTYNSFEEWQAACDELRTGS